MLMKDKVFILKKTKYGEADLILQCLSPRGARLNLFARAALKSKRRFGGGVLEPTHYVDVLYQEKKGEQLDQLHILKEASLIEGFDEIRTDYARLEAGLHFVRLIGDMTREGEVDSKEIFNLLGNALKAAETSTQLAHLRIQFEVKLLANQGVLPLEADEEILLRTPISEHDKISFPDRNWSVVQMRAGRVLSEYLGKAH